MDTGLTIAIVAVAMLVGLVGTVMPLVPGIGLILAAAVFFGVMEGFGTVGVVAMMIIAALALAGVAAGYVLPKRAAGAAGAASGSLVIGLAGAIAGFFLLPIIGLPVGGALGIYLGERARTGQHDPAWRATVATLKGFGIGALVQLGAGVAMVLTWVGWAVVSG